MAVGGRQHIDQMCACPTHLHDQLLSYASALLCFLLPIHTDDVMFGYVSCASVTGAGGCAGGAQGSPRAACSKRTNNPGTDSSVSIADRAVRSKM